MAQANKHAAPRGRKSVTQDWIRDRLHYEEKTGLFTRKYDWIVGRKPGWVKAPAGSVAGCVADHGHTKYITLSIDRIKLYGHQAAFLYMTGHIPGLIDHEDNDGTHNWWTNLREATPPQSSWNVRRNKRNTSGVKGVYWHKADERWMARIRVNGKYRFLGNFEKIEDARDAYARAAKELCGEFARTE